MNIDYSIILLYLLVTLFVGFWQGSGIKNLREYAVANNNYSTFAIIATMSATLIGGGTTFGVAGEVYKHGIIYVLVVAGAGLNQIFIGQFIVPRIKNFKQYISTGEIMRSIYGRDAQLITGICAALVSLGFVSTQISAIGNIINHFLGIEYFTGILIGYGMVILYSSFGGMRSTVATEIIQFIILIIAIPIICSLGINRLGGFENFMQSVPEHSLELNFFHSKLINEFLIFLLVGAFIPSFLQRVLIAKSNDQAKKAVTINGLISLPFYLIIGLIGLIAITLAPNINPDQSIPYLIENILPIGIKGFVIAGMLSVLMSTSDSELTVAGVSVVNDIVKVLFKFNLSEKHEVLFSRLLTAFLGLGTIFIAMKFKNVIEIMLYAFIFWAPTVIVPLTFGLFKFKVNRIVFYLGLITSILSVTVLSNSIKEKLGIDPIVSSIGITTLFYISYFIFTSKMSILRGFKAIINTAITLPITLVDYGKSILTYIIRNFEHKIIKAQINKPYYEFFGIFCFLFYLIPYFLWSHTDKNYFLIIIFRIIACILCVLLIMQESWKMPYRKFLPFYWVVSLTYCLPFVTTFMLLRNNFDLPWIINSIIAMFILVLLTTNWFSFVVTLFSGIFFASVFYYLVIPNNVELIFKYNTIFGIIIYTFSLLIGMIFLFKREESEKIILEKNQALKKLNHDLEKNVSEKTAHLVNALNTKQEFLNNMSHEIRTPIHGILNISNELNNRWDDFKAPDKRKFIRLLADSSYRLSNFVNNILDFSRIESGKMKYDFKEHNLSKLVDEAISYTDHYSDLINKKVLITKKLDDKINIKCDREKFLILLQNILVNAVKYGSKNVYVKANKKNNLFIGINVIDDGIGIPSGEEKEIFEPFVESSRTKNKAGGKGLGLTLCKEIVKAHKGTIIAMNNKNLIGATFVITLPIK